MEGKGDPRWKAVEAQAELGEALEGAAVVVLQFTASWCARCQTVSDELVGRLPGHVAWLKIDVDTSTDLAEEHEVAAMPRIDLYHNGRLRRKFEAFDVSADAVLSAIDEASANPPALELDADF